MSSIKLTADSGGGTVELKAPATTGSNAAKQFILPQNDGSANQLMKTDGSGNLSFFAPPAFRAFLGGAQILANNTTTVISMASETFDSDSFYNTSTYKFTPTVAGYYFINASLQFSNSTADYRFEAKLYKNTSVAARGNFWNDGSNGENHATVSTILAANGSSDYFQVQGFQASGGNITITAGSDKSFFEAFYIRPL